MAEINDRIAPLDELSDFEVADGNPDVRGWEVVASDGRRIGEVDQLLVDTSAMKVRYLDVDLEDALFEGDEDRHALVPIGYARLDEDRNRVVVDQLDSTRVGGLLAYARQPVTPDYEAGVLRSYDPTYSSPTGDLYSHRAYDDSGFRGTRRLGDTG